MALQISFSQTVAAIWKIFDLLLRVILLKERRSQPARVKPGREPGSFVCSYLPFSTLPLHYHTYPPTELIHQFQLGLQSSSFCDYSKTYYFPYCNLILGIYYFSKIQLVSGLLSMLGSDWLSYY